MKILIMRPELPHETREVLDFAPFDHHRKLIREILDGADLEHVSVLASFTGLPPFEVSDMFVDEIGAIKKLPRNEAATLIYRRATMMGMTPVPMPDDPEELPAIYGVAVLFEKRVWS